MTRRQSTPVNDARHVARALIGLGSNQGDPQAQIRLALNELRGIPHTRLLRHSRLFHTRPWGLADQPDFVNAVAEVDSTLGPEALFAELLAIERDHGRRRGGDRWGPRTLDLDLLTFGTLRSKASGLILPHPRLAERAFVLVPLLDLDPDLAIPGVGVVRDLLDRIDTGECMPID